MTSLDPASVTVHGPFLRRLANGLLQSPDLADDAIQETALLAWRKKASSPPPKAWAARTLRHVVRNRRRSLRRRAYYEHIGLRPATDAATLRQRETLRRQLMDAVIRLPEEQRDVIVLRFDDGLPVRKIAAHLDLKTHTVHNRIRRGLAALRTSLDAEHGGDRERWRGALVPLVSSGAPSVAMGWGGWIVGKKLAIGFATLVIVALEAYVVFFPGSDHATDRVATSQPELVVDPADDTPDRDDPPTLDTAHARAPDEQVANDSVARIHGRVLAKDGEQPIEEARVLAFSFKAMKTLHAVTDAQGRFSFPSTRGSSSPVSLVVRHGRFGTFRDRRVLPTIAGRTISLEPGGSISGRLVSLDRAGLKGTVIRAVHRGTKHRLDSALPTALAVEREVIVEKEQGDFRVDGLRPGPYVLLIHVPGLPPLWEASGTPWFRQGGIDVEHRNNVDLGTVKVPHAVPFKVRVIDAHTDAALNGVSFAWRQRIGSIPFVYDAGQPSRTPDGDYLLPLFVDKRDCVLAGNVELHKKGYGDRATTFSGQKKGSTIKFTMVRPGRIVATIPNPPGATALVYRSSDGSVLGVRNVDQDGRAIWEDVPADEALWLVVHDGITHETIWTAPIHVAPGKTTSLSLGNGKGTVIKGSVTLHGKPLPEAFVTLDDPNGTRTQASTNSSGEVGFAGLSPGVYNVGVYLSAPLEQRFECQVELEADREASFRLNLAHRVTGEASWRNENKGLGNPSLTLRRVDGTGWRCSTWIRKDGTFTFMPDGVGTYRIGVEGRKYKLVGDNEIRVHEDLSKLAPVALEPHGQCELTLEVVDAESGKPIAEGDYDFRAGTTTGAGILEGGAATMEFLASGTCNVGVGATGYVRSVFQVDMKEEKLKMFRRVELMRANAVRVADLTDVSRAAEAGLRKDDVILRYASKPITERYSLREAMKGVSSTDTVNLYVLREGRIFKLQIPGGRMGVHVVNVRVVGP